MTHLTLHEWGHARFGEDGLTREKADALHAAACAHPLAREDATNIMVLGRDRLIARQMVGIVSAKGCSLEILPKVDPNEGAEDQKTVRSRLVRMLDVALGLDLGIGGEAAIARQKTESARNSHRCVCDAPLGRGAARPAARLYRARGRSARAARADRRDPPVYT